MNITTSRYLKNNYLYHTINAVIAENKFGITRLASATKHLNNPKYEAALATRINRFVKHIFKIIFNRTFRESFNKALRIINKCNIPAASNNVGPIQFELIHRDVRRDHIIAKLDFPTLFSLGVTSQGMAKEVLEEIEIQEPWLLKGTNLKGVGAIIFAKKKYEKEYDRAHQYILKNIQKLTLRKVEGYETLDELIASGEDKLSLDLKLGHLHFLPPEMMSLDLRVLLLSYNLLSKIPESIGQLKELTHLSLCNNPLRELPPQIQQLTKLRYLDLRQTQFTSEAIAQIRAWLPNTNINV